MASKRITAIVGFVAIMLLSVCGLPVCLETATAANPDYVGAVWIVEDREILTVAASDGTVLLRITQIDKAHSVAVDERNGRLWVLGQHMLHEYGFDGSRLVVVPIVQQRSD